MSHTKKLMDTVEYLNCPLINLDVSARLLFSFSRLEIEVLLDLLVLIYKEDPSLDRVLGLVSRTEIYALFYHIDPVIIKSLPFEWQQYYSMNPRFIGRF